MGRERAHTGPKTTPISSMAFIWERSVNLSTDPQRNLLTGVKDVASAEATLPKLTELLPKIDGIKSLTDKLPAAGKDSIKSMIGSQLGSLNDLIAKVTAIPVVGDKL